MLFFEWNMVKAIGRVVSSMLGRIITRAKSAYGEQSAVLTRSGPGSILARRPTCRLGSFGGRTARA